MKTDRYTKVVLTVIAICLVVNILEKIDIIPKAYANGSDNDMSPINSNYAIVPVNEDGSINVTVKATAPMDVNLVRISTNDDLDVNVNVEKIGGRSVYGEIPVTVKQ